ncbi:putative ABC transport system permease protein [Hydrogenispora ethanolica]|uniref:Putative ABC transport system permease protein n=1 Tax=Hydrogenispora ethanolica TaxID=1082276 RepID=A0A4R1SAC9_HYDET|nr:ABC transporter permease [Hydrogenispora ethanolica]TCL76398.1 putative ABC transport system permease protein [Hydrogenispora ethanolica]
MLRFYAGLAFKNLLRHKRRAILTTLAIAFGIFYYIIFDSMMAGMDRESVQNMLNLEVGHIQVLPKAAAEEKSVSLKHLIPNGRAVVGRIAKMPGISGVTPRLLFPVSLTTGLEELPLTGVGVDPQRDAAVFRIPGYVAGRWLRPGEAAIVLGKSVAELLQVKLGDMVTIRTRTRLNTFQALDVKLVGLIDSPNPAVNESQVFIPLDTAENALGTAGAISMIVVKTESFANLGPVIQALRQLDPHGTAFRIKTWREAAEGFLAAMEAKRGFSYVLLFLVGVISFIGVVNSVLLASLERVREIGILKAMGMTEAEITRLFAYEAMGIGLMGGLAGVLLAVLANLYLVNHGWDFAKMYGGSMGLSVGKLYGVWNWPVIFGAVCFGLLVAMAASLLPARKAAQADPAISLRKI